MSLDEATDLKQKQVAHAHDQAHTSHGLYIVRKEVYEARPGIKAERLFNPLSQHAYPYENHVRYALLSAVWLCRSTSRQSCM